MPRSALHHRPIAGDADGQSTTGITPVAQRASPAPQEHGGGSRIWQNICRTSCKDASPDAGQCEAQSQPACAPTAAPGTRHDRHAHLVDGVVPGRRVVEYPRDAQRAC